MKITIYKCPVCGSFLQDDGISYRCDKNHTFDISKDGYVNLLLADQKSSKEPGDSREAVVSRRAFLDSDYFLKQIDQVINGLQ